MRFAILLGALWPLLASAQFKKCKRPPNHNPVSQDWGNHGNGGYSQTSPALQSPINRPKPSSQRPPPIVSSQANQQPISSISKSNPPPKSTSTPPANSGGKRGIGWAADNNAAAAFSSGQMSWYFAWQNAPIQGMTMEYYPMLWGKGDAVTTFDTVMADLASPPKHVLAFNEPNIEGQALMSTSEAADLYRTKLQPLKTAGMQVAAPALSYDAQWFTDFFNACDGCEFSAIQAHWYGGWNEIDAFQKWIESLHDQFQDRASEIWVTEWGVTSKSGGTEDQVFQFLKDSTIWLEQQSYVTRIAWFGAWSKNPDGYASDFNSMVDGNGALTRAGQFWVNNVG